MGCVDVTGDNYKDEIFGDFVLLYFWAPWCGPCRVMNLTINELASQEFPNIQFCKINADREDKLVQYFKIKTVPTFMIVKKGEILSTFSGLTTKSELINKLQK